MQSISSLVRHPEFRKGAGDMVHIALGIFAWGLVTGVAMVKSGLSLPLAIFMSLVVYAGSAQLAVMPLILSGAPMWVVWATAACVNLRFVIFSAVWRPYFAVYPRATRMLMGYFSGDVNYVVFMKRFPEPVPEPAQVPYYWGGVSVNWSAWQFSSLAGMLLADAIPTHWGLGFAGVLALLGVMASLLHDRATWGAAGVAGAAAIAAYALPLKLNILVAIAAAVAAGLIIESVEVAARMRARDRARAGGGKP